jgi:hypothetical protein
MDGACPHCGAQADLVERPARVLHGACSGCGQSFTIVQEAAGEVPPPDVLAPELPLPEASGAPAMPAAAATSAVAGPICPTCGSPLALRTTSPQSLETRCAACGSTTKFVLARPPSAGMPPAPYPARGGPRRDGRPGPGPGGARPCRECGGPLRFSTDAEGNVTGECSSCGNRFTLPPRPRFGLRPRDRGDRRGPDRLFRANPPSRAQPWRREPGEDRPRRFRGSIGAFRPRDKRKERDSGESDERRRRRRTRG